MNPRSELATGGPEDDHEGFSVAARLGTEFVRAAGGVVTRPVAGDGRSSVEDVEVLVVHRPRYDDWTIPKGKLDPGETWEQAALREVEEETGLRCDLCEPVAEVRYRDNKGRPKAVRYWRMTVIDGEFTPNDEVDEIRWLTPAEAAALLTYEHDRTLPGLAAGL
ncbi:MAG: NUDIX hydrolase [Acidimicrobiales bacterium]|nr:NUDIX hydrolase [Acidimicrobiales bacterium]